jgi:DNA-binding CsgD family transcriptional regulator
MLIRAKPAVDDTTGADLAVSQLYDAAIDGQFWSESLMELIRTVGGFDGQLLLSDRGNMSFLAEPLPSSIPGNVEYISHWASQDVRRMAADRLPVGTMMACNHYFDDSFVARSALYQEFLIPGGWRYVAGGRVLVSSGKTAYVGIHRLPDQGPFGSRELTLLSQVAPHLGRAVRLRCKLAEVQSVDLSFRAALDQIGTPIFILDGDRRPLFLNRAADATVAMKDGLAVREGKLLLASSTADNELTRLLVNATVTTGRSSGGSLRIPRSANRTPYAAEIVPLSPRSSGYAEWQRPVALLRLVDPDRRTTPVGRRLVELFKLTPAEARIAVALVEGKTAAEIADDRKISMPTVRSQIAAVLSKCGVRRQVELVNFLARLQSGVSLR